MSRPFFLSLFFFFFLAIGPERFAQAADLSVLSYNIKGLPSTVNGAWDEERYREIGAELASRDRVGSAPAIVLLQEAFAPRVAELWETASQAYPHRARGPLPTSFLGVCGGLYILSRYPIVEHAQESFGSDLCASWDCLANKGVQLARIAVPGLAEPLEVYNTHMQASRASDGIRVKQVAKLAAFFKQHHRAGAPVLFGGDFNFRPGSGHESYALFRKLTGLRHSAEECFKPGGACAGSDSGAGSASGSGERGELVEYTVDHHFVADGLASALVPVKAQRNFRPVKGRRLSDHLGYEVAYAVKVVSPAPGVKAAKTTDLASAAAAPSPGTKGTRGPSSQP